ncbi:MAG: hypothetical protein ACRYFA_12970 [Janthinobacterium lividum]
MKTFDLELRVETYGSVITWEILLEDATNRNRRIRDWMQADNYRYKKLPHYIIADDVLTVFAGCQGIIGGTLTCEVLINGVVQPEKLISQVQETEYAKVNYPVL